MSADLRTFRYPLEAAVQVREWRIERLLRNIAEARAALATLKRQQRELGEACTTQACAARGAWTAAPDPSGRQQMLGYLVGLKARQLDLRADDAAAAAEIAALKQALLDEQVSLRALEEHRAGARDVFTLAQRQADDAAADARWLILSVWRQRSARGAAQ